MRFLMQTFDGSSSAFLKARVEAARRVRVILTLLLFCAGGASLAQVPVQPGTSSSTDRAGEVVFVAGTVLRHPATGAPENLAKGMALQEGDRIQAQADGYVYVRMADAGLLVVRPMSELRIDKWRFDPLQPQLSQIRYTLNNGVARYVSGRGSQAAKDKFRFNTPLAAIGVRGTDFTVLAEPTLTRVIVRSGGVVVSNLGPGCREEALGPCEGVAATELFASAREKMIQYRQGDARPELVDSNVAPSPDKVRPPAPSEPVASRRPAVATDVAIEDYRTQDIVNSYVPPVAPVAPEPIVPPAQVTPEPPNFLQAVSGRTSAVPGSSVPRSSLDDILEGRSLIASNRYFAVAGTRTDKVILPNAGSAEFKLTSHQGIIVDKVANQAVDSLASNGSLRIDFANRLFTTGFDLQSKDVSTRIEGNGSIGSDGKMLSAPFKSPTLVQGLVGGPEGAEAVYIYQRSLSKQFDAAGVASWGKK